MIFEIWSNLGHIFRVCSGYVQSVFRVYSECVYIMIVVKIVVIASSSASSVSVFGIFSYKSSSGSPS